jgi:hypothetical protein
LLAIIRRTASAPPTERISLSFAVLSLLVIASHIKALKVVVWPPPRIFWAIGWWNSVKSERPKVTLSLSRTRPRSTASSAVIETHSLLTLCCG